jgi:hypothetical protein
MIQQDEVHINCHSMVASHIDSVEFIWPAFGQLSSNGLVFRETGYRRDDHWTGERKIPADRDDFDFWKWIFVNRFLLPPILNSRFLPNLQEYFEHRIQPPVDASEVVPVPNDGFYFNDVFVSEEAQRLFVELAGALSNVRFIPLRNLLTEKPSLDFLSIMCLGLGEVLVYKNGRCGYFAAVCEKATELPEHVRLIRRLLR